MICRSLSKVVACTILCAASASFSLPATDWFGEISGQGFLKTRQAEGIGYRHGYSTAGLFVTRGRSCDAILYPFVDVRGHVFNNGKGAANAGVGARFLTPSKNHIFGANVYYDFRQIQNDGFHQVGAGLEYIGCGFGARVNGYFPTGDRLTLSDPCRFDYEGGYFAICQGNRKTLCGVDGEIFTSQSLWCDCSCLDWYIGVGAYHYDRECASAFTGGKVRVGFYCCNCFSLEARASYDEAFNSRYQVTMGLHFPFGTCRDCCYSFLNWLCRPVEREEIIVNSKRYTKWQTNF